MKQKVRAASQSGQWLVLQRVALADVNEGGGADAVRKNAASEFPPLHPGEERRACNWFAPGKRQTCAAAVALKQR